MTLGINPELESEYNRLRNEIGPEPYDYRDVLGIYDVLRAHFLLVDYFWKHREGVGGVGPRDTDLLHSALGRQIVGFAGVRKWNDPLDICSTLFYGLVKDHAFHDCNKRTALLSALYFLNQHDRVPTAPQRDLERLTLRTAENALTEYPEFKRYADQDDSEVRFISHFLRRNTRIVDKKIHIITYQQLDTLLKRHGAFLANPDGNYIDVMQKKKRRVGFLGLREEAYEDRVMKIGFPGMKVQVNPKTIKDIRRALGLTHDKGCDSEAFFGGADTMQSLIATYAGLMQRLANR